MLATFILEIPPPPPARPPARLPKNLTIKILKSIDCFYEHGTWVLIGTKDCILRATENRVLRKYLD
jgi:hypothetical protein